jgi:hypothetical protein
MSNSETTPKMLPWMPRHHAIGYVLFPVVVLLYLLNGGCANTPTIVAGDPQADCNLAPDLQEVETVTALPEDHVIPLPELRQLLKGHMLHEKQIADRSNDKTDFVNAQCRGQHGTGSSK